MDTPINGRTQLGPEEPIENLIGRREILFEQRRRHLECRGQITEAVPLTCIIRHPDRRGGIEFKSQQIANRAVEFRQTQPPNHRRPWITLGRIIAIHHVDRPLHPREQPLLFLSRQLRSVFRRHRSRLKLSDSLPPEFALPSRRLVIGDRGEVDVA